MQRIEAVRLAKSGAQVRVTLRASSMSDASIKRLYISRANPGPSADLYNSDTDLTMIVDAPLTITMDRALPLPLVDYALDQTRPLLVAVDFSDAPPSGIRTSDHAVGSPDIHVPPEEAQTFFRTATEAAATADRTGFDPTPGLNLIYKIEVVEPWPIL